jgi:hypothetical protein
MRSKSERLNEKVAAPKQQFRRRVLLVACLSLAGLLGRATASELVIGREALQTVMVASLFKDQGRWYLVKGKCFAYLERPNVTPGRIHAQDPRVAAIRNRRRPAEVGEH